MTAQSICLITNCNNRTPASEPFCKQHREEEYPLAAMVKPTPPLSAQARELLGDIHHHSAQLQHFTIYMLSNQYIGQEWRLRMQHSHDRITTLMERLKVL